MTPVTICYHLSVDGFITVPTGGEPGNLLTLLADETSQAPLDFDSYDLEAKCAYCGREVDLDELDGYECPCQDEPGPCPDEAYETKRQDEVDLQWLT
jgi:hypothetical protein